MDAPGFTNLLIIVAVAFAVPFTLGLLPRVKLPAVVLELVLGIVVGPAVLGWVTLDETVSVIALIGLVFLLFLAGLEIEFEHLRGRVLKLTGLAWLASFAIAVAVAYALQAGGLVQTPLLVAVILSATSLGVIIPVLKDAGEIATPFGQLVVAAGTIADFGAIILLSILFTGEGGTTATLLLIAALLGMAVVRFDLDALLASMDAIVKVPLFLLALLAIRGLPALAYRGAIGARRTAVAALLQATSLPFIVAGTAIGLELGLVGGGEAAALVAAGLLSLLVFPLAGLTILRGGGGGSGSALGDRDVPVGADGQRPLAVQ